MEVTRASGVKLCSVLLLLLAAWMPALAGCRSVRLEAGFKLPAELTATAQAVEAPATPGASPARSPTRPAPTPGPGAEHARALIAGLVAEQLSAGADLETTLMSLGQLRTSAGILPRAVAVRPQSPDELPLILVAYGEEGSPWILGRAAFWWQGAELHEQDFDRDTFGPDSAFVAARQQVRGGKLELGLVYDANSGGSSQVQVYRLLRLEGGEWQTVWDGLRDSGGRWKTCQAAIALPEGGGLETIALRSSSWQVVDGREGFFHESNPGPHRYFDDVWVRRGDGYELAGYRVEPSAYATLVEFVYRLSIGDDAEAARLVTDPGLLARAREAGLGYKPASPWSIYLDSEDDQKGGPIRFFEGPKVTVLFEERSGEWLIKGIVPGGEGG